MYSKTLPAVKLREELANESDSLRIRGRRSRRTGARFRLLLRGRIHDGGVRLFLFRRRIYHRGIRLFLFRARSGRNGGFFFTSRKKRGYGQNA